MKPIETKYAGCRFRSRLEARWAVFFDHLKLEWVYEPEGFVLPDGSRYLPDFYLPGLKAYVEIKPKTSSFDYESWEPEKDSKAYKFLEGLLKLNESEDVPTRYFYIVGQPGKVPSIYSQPSATPWEETDSAEYESYKIFSHDVDYYFCSCGKCGVVGIEFEGRAGRLQHLPDCPLTPCDRYHHANSKKILTAAKAARSARFEFGESGYVSGGSCNV